MSAIPAGAPTTGRRTTTIGGIGYALAAVLQLLAMVRVLVPSAPAWATPGWQLGGWLLGGIVLVAASVVLGSGGEAGPGITGRSVPGRIGLGVSGGGGVLLAAVSVLTLAFGPAASPWAPVAVVGTQLLVLAADLVAASAVIRARAVDGAARWAPLGLVVVDAAAVLVRLVPGLLPQLGTGTASLLVALVVRPVVVLAIGVVLVLRARP